MVVNLKCGLCKFIYDFEIGEPKINNSGKLVFEHKSICPKCKAKDKDLLTELGQSQMTAWYLGGL
jgi:rubredoxin